MGEKAKQQVEVRWERSPHHRIIYANGVIGSTMDIGDGEQVIIRLTTNWGRIDGEVFQAEVTEHGDGTRSISQAEESRFNTTNIKIEEAALILGNYILDSLGNPPYM
jgi:hypothetical protein